MPDVGSIVLARVPPRGLSPRAANPAAATCSPAVAASGGGRFARPWPQLSPPSRTSSTASSSIPPTVRPSRSSIPPPARRSPRRPCPRAADVDRAVKAAGAAYDGWATTTPGERALALLKLADAIEEHADELAELESDNAGKPINAFRDDEIPFMVDNLRVLRGRRAVPRGPCRRRVRERLHVDHPPRAGRGGRADRAVELPADDGRVEDRPGPGGREHDRAQAGRDDSADRAQARRARGARSSPRACST